MELNALENGPAFLQLPVELFLEIWEYLSVDDILALRLVCRRIETVLFDSFCKEFFTERRFSVTFNSLKTLVEITQCPRLGHHLTSITIGLDRLHTIDALPRFADSWDDFNHTIPGDTLVKAGIDPYKLETFTREQDFLLSSGKLQLMLSEAFSNLSRLEELIIRDHKIPRRKARIGMCDLLVSYGWSYILRETGIDFTGPELHLNNYDDSFIDIVFSSTILALAQSRLQINTLKGDIFHPNIGLSSSAFTIPEFIHQDIHPVLFNLRSLYLAVSFVQVPLGSYSTRSNSFLKWEKHQLFSFLEKTPNLDSLRISARRQGHIVDGIMGLLAIFLDPADPAAETNHALYRAGILNDSRLLIIPPFEHRFRALKELEMCNMTVPIRDICKILDCLSPSLRVLTLIRIALIVQGDDDEMDNNPFRPNAWSSLFSRMNTSLNLEQLALASLEHHTPSCSLQNGHSVAFLPSNIGKQRGPPNGILYSWSHQGSADTIREFLEVLQVKTIVLCRTCKTRNAGYMSSNVLDIDR
ncbi:hypothetical protein F5B22DRAFT_118799 [Xylaria bambusicola]|uniref:uncharacterized protein n=1 Tax=Xylaria bambusicola TaxID=326684 RepID=UPI002007B551|nr:uncharacterized protein F5B22DRAFT_118799 [Xylaria bambusicola]KAI0517338.1 hypothetical protein F5B22DRAFT_118799 [Xylaria bambusicola]